MDKLVPWVYSMYLISAKKAAVDDVIIVRIGSQIGGDLDFRIKSVLSVQHLNLTALNWIFL